VGAVVGGVDAIMEQSRASGFSETVKWETPVMKNTMEVPRDASVMIRDDVQYSQDAFKDSRLYTDPAKFNLDKHMKGEKVTVDAQVPQKNLFGQYKMDEQTQTVDGVKARYGVVGNVFGGVVLGGVLGVASGVALNILKKMVNA